MASRYSEALDVLHDMVRWILSDMGHSVISARGAYLMDNTYNALAIEEAELAILGTLNQAEPVYWESPYCQIVEKSAPQLPDSWRLTDPFLFTRSGFIWFGRAIQMPDGHDKGGCNRGEAITAISWQKRPKSIFIDVVFYIRPSEETIIRIFGDGVREEHLTGHELAIHKQLSDDLADSRKRARTIQELVRKLDLRRYGGIPWVVMPWRSGETIRQLYDSTVPAAELDEDACVECNMIYMRTFGAALNFLNSKVMVSHRETPDRQTLKRVASKPEWNEINVVSLRRTEQTKHKSDVESTEVDWSCHWLVGAKDGGFWRHQYMPRTKTKEWRWIGQFIKGNLDKPFKPPSKRGYVVTR